MELVALDETANWCMSGGADGSDLQWGMCAGYAGHGVIHWSFDKHFTEAPHSEVVILPEELLLAADPYCKLANKTLKRRFPTKSIGGTNLLRRNWYQVCYSGSCYGVSSFNLPVGERIPEGTVLENPKVNGGTAWAVQMFIDRFNGEACECYIFDQNAGYWFKWEGHWVRIYEPPVPQGIWAGIGTRDINYLGKLAIRQLMNYQKRYVRV